VLLDPLAHASGKSFPSGHAMTSFVAFGVLIVLVHGRRQAIAAVAALVLVPLVGFSRLALGVHYLSDVLGAWLLGATWLLAVHWIFQRRAPDGTLIGPADAGAKPDGRS
jgi:undecaprenyl-diphosphatase